MTIICAAHDGEATWIASETLALINGDVLLEEAPKWSVRGAWAIGAAGAARTNNLIEQHADRILGAGGIYEILEALRAVLGEHGYVADTSQGRPPDYDSAYVVACPGKAWTVDCTMAWQQVRVGELAARGSGMQFGIGAAHAVRYQGTEAMVRAAVEAAMRYDPACGGEIWTHALRA